MHISCEEEIACASLCMTKMANSLKIQEGLVLFETHCVCVEA